MLIYLVDGEMLLCMPMEMRNEIIVGPNLYSSNFALSNVIFDVLILDSFINIRLNLGSRQKMAETIFSTLEPRDVEVHIRFNANGAISLQNKY